MKRALLRIFTPGVDSVFVILLLCTVSVQAQEFNHYDITNGLSSIEVTDIRENDHFMWIATCDGLNRFDGENFKIYKRENDSLNCLTENNIETLFFDSDGFLWIGLKTGGADIYDPRRDEFIHVSKIVEGKTPARVISIMEDSRKNIWLGTWEEGVCKLSPAGKSEKHYTSEIHYSGYIVSSLIEKPKGFVRIGTYFGCFAYDIQQNTWIDYDEKDKAITQFLDTGEEHALWASTWNSGLLKISWPVDRPEQIKISQRFDGQAFKSIYRIIRSNGKIYLGTWGQGLKVTDSGDPSQAVPVNDDRLDATLINCLFRDRYKNIWIGTYGGGIFRFMPEKKGIEHYPLSEKLPAPAISLAPFGKNHVLIGTQGAGVFLCNLKTKKLIPKFSNQRNGELNNYILSMFSDKNLVFAGHDGFGLPFSVLGNGADPSFRFKEHFSAPQLEKVTAVYPAADGRIWIGTKQNGLISVKINPLTKKVEDYRHYDSFGRDEITGFAPYDANHLFISSHNGLFLFNTETTRIEENGQIRTNEIVYRIVRDNANSCLWIGTSTNLLRLNLDDPRSVRHAFPEDLLPQGAIRALMTDKHNNLWFAIGERLFCAVGTEKKIREINPGLLGNHAILSSACVSCEDGEQLIFGTTDNLIMIDPARVLNQPDESKIIFTNLEVNHRKVGVNEKIHGNVVLKEATEYVSSIRLSYRSRWISFSFTESGRDIYRNKYQYRIAGFSDTWQYLNLSYPITFSQLDPGEYRLEIRKYDGSIETPVCWSMDILITPPWWNTLWFYALATALILAGASLTVFLIVRHYRKKQVLKLQAIERQKEEELLREKESFFTGLSHDLLTPFSLILAPVNDLIRESRRDDPGREKLEIISKNTSFLSDIFGTILDFKRVELSDVELKESKVEIVSFARLVVNAFEYLAGSRKIVLSFNADPGELHVFTDSVKLERILYNLLSNAIKYSPDGGQVTVNLKREEQNLHLSVRDSGPGIDEKHQLRIFEKFYRGPEKTDQQNPQGFGLGLYVVKKFVQVLNGSIRIQSAPGQGTQIELILPVKAVKQDQPETEPVPGFSDDTSTILIVEDNDQMRKYLKEKLSKHFTVLTAANGKEAMEYLDEYLPEIILTDVMMPEMDGLELCRLIKENQRYADIFVVMLTAKTSAGDELQGYKTGADIYVKKPFDPEVLLNQMINIQHTRQHRKTQLLSRLVSKEGNEIEFDPKETFLKRSMQVIEEHLMDADFKIDEFAARMNMSKTVLHRKFRLLVGQTPNQFIRLVRLRKSVELLRNSDHTIAEIAYLTGFNQSHYFIKCFREVYNETPKSFRQQK